MDNIDANGVGYIDRTKLQRLCPHLSSLEIETIFQELDHDQDNRICLKELLKSDELIQENPIDFQLNPVKEHMTQTQIQEVFNNLSCQEQIYEFYEALRSSSDDITDQFQSILEIFVADILKYRKDIKRLEDSFKREKETNEKYLRAIEEDQERDMRQLEDKIRQEERQRFDNERESIVESSSKEIRNLKSDIQRLQRIEQIHTDRKNEEDSSNILLHNEIAKLREENQSLHTSLNDSLTTIAILKSDLQSTKSQLTERQSILLQERQSLNGNQRERDSMQTNIRQLVQVNKQLRDENDSLRASIETYTTNSTSRHLSTASNLGAYWNDNREEKVTPSNLVENRDLGSADELDSGLSLMTMRDATEFETDNEQKFERQTSFRTSKNKNADTDSDDAFVEIDFKRSTPRRTSKRTSTHRNLSKQRSTIVPTPIPIQPIQESNISFDRMFKIVFCGDAAVGKSTLMMRLTKEKFVNNINSTMGVDFQNKQIEIDNKHIALQLWDTAGQERFRSIAKSYFRRSDGVILVYDSTYERSFLNVREWIQTINESISKKVSVLIVANKIDAREQARAQGRRVIEYDEGIKLAKEYSALFIETSAKEGTNTNEALIELTRDMQCNEDLERFHTVGIDLDKKSTKKSICCGN